MEEKQKDQERVNTNQGWWDSGSKFAKEHWVGLLILLVNVIALVGLIAILIWDCWGWWEWLREGQESTSTTVRNLGLSIAAIIGLELALWRSFIADRQSKTAQRQSETVQRGLLNERYQKGAEMLGSPMLSVRLGGIYALERLAREHAEDYHVQITRLFCAFVRKPIKDETAKNKNDNGVQSESNKQKEDPKIREDVQAIMTALGRRNKKQQKIEKQETSKESILDLAGADLSSVVLDDANLSGAWLKDADLSKAKLSRADLSGAELDRANLSNAELTGVDLSGAKLDDADLSGTKLSHANLSDAWFIGTKFARLEDVDSPSAGFHELDLSDVVRLYRVKSSGAHLYRTNLSGAVLSFARGLTQAQLDEAVADPDNPPKLTDAKCSKTGEPLFPDRLFENLQKTE